jgi:DMSO/TMAO reductase YedYZ molybdopterin-dependent catalytic subunit
MRLPRQILSVSALLGMLAMVAGCETRPSEAQLTLWQQEAIAANQEIADKQGKRNDSSEQWQFSIQGQINQNQPIRFSLNELKAISPSQVRTKDPHYLGNRNQVNTFLGITVNQLLERFPPDARVRDITFVSFDGYRSTVDIDDLRRFPIMLAWERNGVSIPRNQGGPIYLVFPHTEFPELETKYPGSSWSFYVTDMVVGTEVPSLKVGDRTLDETTLAGLPPITIEEQAGYTFGWPVGKIRLTGFRVRDLLTAAGVFTPERSRLVIRGKASSDQSRDQPITIPIEDIKTCDIILVNRWGMNNEPIPARMGGPLTLAFPSNCRVGGNLRSYPSRHWVSFVERIEIEPEN